MDENIKVCAYCQQSLSDRMFYDNPSPYMNGKMVYCMDCSGEIANDMICSDVSVNRGIRKMCSFFNIPYWESSVHELTQYIEDKKSLWEKKQKDLQEMNCIKFYLDSLHAQKLNQKYWNDLTGMGYLGYRLLKSVKEEDGDIELFEELEKQWGKQADIADYIFLTDRYNAYAKGRKLTPAAKNTIHYLCLAELEVQQAKEKREDTSKLEEKIGKYYKTLGLSNFNISDEKPMHEKLIENWAMIEETMNPIEWVDERFDDICHFREDNAEIMRSIGNVALGNKNYPNLTLEDIENYATRNNAQKVKK